MARTLILVLPVAIGRGHERWRTKNSWPNSALKSARLNVLISKGKAPAKVILKARILLKADKAEGGAGWSDDDVCRALDTNVTMVQRVREKLETEGLDAVLTRKKRETPPITPIFDGAAQAQLTALACSEPPPGPCPAGRSVFRRKKLWNAKSSRRRTSTRSGGR